MTYFKNRSGDLIWLRSVYFIGNRRYVKIGHDVRPDYVVAGLNNLTSGRLYPRDLAHYGRVHLLWHTPGGQSEEFAYHRQFTKHRASGLDQRDEYRDSIGEWFDADPVVAWLVAKGHLVALPWKEAAS